MLGIFLTRRDPATTIRILMEDGGWSVKSLAEESGVHRNTISAIRTGDTDTPNMDTRIRLASTLGVKVNKIWPNA